MEVSNKAVSEKKWIHDVLKTPDATKETLFCYKKSIASGAL
jgi:hypothetical protein